MMVSIISSKETTDDGSDVSKESFIHLLEPPMEYIVKSIFKDRKVSEFIISYALSIEGTSPCKLGIEDTIIQ